MIGDGYKPGEQYNYVDLLTETPPMHHTKIKVVLKKNPCNLDGLNVCFQEWIAVYFKFNIIWVVN